MRKLFVVFNVVLVMLLLTSCGCESRQYDEEWISSLTGEAKLHYDYDFDTTKYIFTKEVPNGWVVRFTGKMDGDYINIYLRAYNLPKFDDEDFIYMYYSEENDYEYYVDFRELARDGYTYVEHLSDPWYSYIGERGVCTSSLE